MKTLFVTLLFLIFAAIPVHAKNLSWNKVPVKEYSIGGNTAAIASDRFFDGTYWSDITGRKRSFIAYLPKDFNKWKSYDVLIHLSGGDGSRYGLPQFFDSIEQELDRHSYRKNLVILTPHLGDLSLWARTKTSPGPWLVQEFAQFARNRFHPNRVFLSGHSAGGAAVMSLAFDFRHQFEKAVAINPAVVPFSAFSDREEDFTSYVTQCAPHTSVAQWRDLAERVSAAFGEPKYYDAFNPLLRIQKSKLKVPLLIALGDSDRLGFWCGVEDFVAHSKAQRILPKIQSYQGGHEIGGFGQALLDFLVR